jgi:hypothetical protein
MKETAPNKFWRIMKQRYGGLWVSKYGDRPNDAWRKFLEEIPPHRIRRGLEADQANQSEYPPSFPVFAGYCAERFGENEEPTPKPIVQTDEVAFAACEEMRRILGV